MIVVCLECGRFLGFGKSSFSAFLFLLFGEPEVRYEKCPKCLEKQRIDHHLGDK